MIKIKYIFAATAMVMLAGCAMPGTDAGSQGQMAKTYEVFFDLGRADIGEVSA
ncbi:MAG: lipoprotein, partial [Rhodospirillaceae bacterium]|nr:lipoprotein [Rhodospirillales bacterium]